MKLFKSIRIYVKGIWLALLGRPIIYTDRKDWSVTYGSGTQHALPDGSSYIELEAQVPPETHK